jgi:uncharacterized protein (TIGR02594 family)
MAWRKTAAVLTVAMVPTFAAISVAVADQQPPRHHYRDASDMDQQQPGILVSASSGDAAWIASQLHQPHFAARNNRPVISMLDDSRADANAMPDGPHVNGFRSDAGPGPARVLPVAEHYRGTNPTGHSRAWCAVFANMVLARTGYSGTGSAAARSFARYGRAASGPAPGVIAVWPHHVGFVVGAVAPGRIRVISGNHNHRVAESTYATRGVMAFRYPDRVNRSMTGFASASTRHAPL